MNSLYSNADLTGGYLHLIELSRLASHSPDRSSPDQSEMESTARETYYQSLIKRIYASLQQLSPQSLPQLHLHAWRGELDMLARLNAESTFADRRGIHVGLSSVLSLDAAILTLSAYLMENYSWQINPLAVDTPPSGDLFAVDATLMRLSLYAQTLPSIADVVSLADFPAEALSLYSAHLIPESETQDGYQKRPFQLIMECLQEARLAASHMHYDQRVLTRAVPKPLLDLVDFCDRFDFGKAAQAYLDSDKGSYLLRLHLQLLLDGLYFLIAHEVAHYQLGHLEHREASVAQLREEEAAADAAALTLLRTIPGFQARSLIIIFQFARSKESEAAITNRMDHPLAHNRLLVLADTLLAQPHGYALRADVNAGLALLPSRLAPQFLTFGWENEGPEDVDIYVSWYSDMDYTAHLMVYINRPPRHTGRPVDANAENAFLLSHLAYEIHFEVRDRIDPGKVYDRGRAWHHPTIRPQDLFTNIRTETVFSRLHLPIPAPPEFCLKWPGAELAVRNIEISYQMPDLKKPEERRNPVRFFYNPGDLQVGDFLQTLPPLEQDPTLQFRLLLAARRYADYGRPDASIDIYQWLYRKNPELLVYGDLVQLAAQLMDSSRFAEAAEIARWALAPGRVQRPKFHYLLALDHANRGEAQESYEEAFLEMALFGSFGEMFDDARDMCGTLADGAADPVLAGVRVFRAHIDAADQARTEDKRERALAEFRAGRDALLVCQRDAHRDFVFLRQLLSDVALEISLMEGNSFATASEAAKAVLALRPDFVPALMNLAKISQLQGDRKAAYAVWQQAHAVAPFHSIVFEKREEFEYGLS